MYTNPTVQLLRSLPTASAPLVLVRRSNAEEPAEGWKWKGRIIGRIWRPRDFDAREVLLMRVGGRKRRLQHPDEITRAGTPRWHLSDREWRDAQRLLDRHCVDQFVSENVACTAGRNVLLNFIGGAGGLSGVNYFAVGTGTLPVNGPQASDTQLVTEFFRTTLASATTSGNAVDLSATFQTAQANTTYTEAGIFGNGATATANSGSLFAHAPYTYQKQPGTVLTNDYLISLS